MTMASRELRNLFVIRPGEQFSPLNLSLEDEAFAAITFVVMPGASADILINADLKGSGAEVVVRGIYLCGGEEAVSVRTNIRHLVGDCRSSQLICGAVGGAAHTSFDGLVYVAQDAQKTEAFQTNRNILLSEEAKIETKPQLEIYADDVKCSHGATVGRLSEDEQFYMRSRGIPEAEAKVLQTLSFLAPVLDGVPERESLLEQLECTIREII